MATPLIKDIYLGVQKKCGASPSQIAYQASHQSSSLNSPHHSQKIFLSHQTIERLGFVHGLSLWTDEYQCKKKVPWDTKVTQLALKAFLLRGLTRTALSLFYYLIATYRPADFTRILESVTVKVCRKQRQFLPTTSWHSLTHVAEMSMHFLLATSSCNEAEKNTNVPWAPDPSTCIDLQNWSSNLDPELLEDPEVVTEDSEVQIKGKRKNS